LTGWWLLLAGNTGCPSGIVAMTSDVFIFIIFLNVTVDRHLLLCREALWSVVVAQPLDLLELE
jgi:hypothetical protein